MRVANLDMRDSNTQCPGPLRERMDSSIRTPLVADVIKLHILQKILIS